MMITFNLLQLTRYDHQSIEPLSTAINNDGKHDYKSKSNTINDLI